ncbi:MAG TPA: response regulator [Candidatus Binatia bacterium]|nr:response regulator [Candidatus Binatia bacterium]
MSTPVLIIDDSLTVRMDLAACLTSAGFAPTTCATAAAARAALERTAFALVVLDVLLPDADGIELLASLKRDPATASVPVMLLSAEAEVRDRIRGLRTGADEYVGKPYDPSYVVARARELVRRGTPATAETRSDAVPTVLVIDDSATFREHLRSTLEAAGYAVTTASTGEEGLRLAAAVRPAAVVVDGMLPGVDGATVVRRLRLDAALRRTPCLLLTASDDREDELRAFESGADAFVRKGEDAGVVLARLAAVLRSTGGSADADAGPSVLGPKKILAVDDSPTYLEALASQVRGEGYDVILARSGEEALNLIAVEPVDCILLDLVMPGLTGQETCRRIKSMPAARDVPLIVLTALEEQSAMIESINAGADDYITKSEDFEVLKARLRAQLRRKQLEDEHRRIREELLRKEMEAAEGRAARELAETRARLLADVQQKNEQLEAFSYSVSHDLRAPLRAIDGYARILLEDHADRLDAEGRRVLDVVCETARRMGKLIDDLLAFSHVGRAELEKRPVDMAALARAVVAELQGEEPGRAVTVTVGALLPAFGDAGMLRQVFVNLIGNAWKFTRGRAGATIDVGCAPGEAETTYFVRDDGAGFDMRYAGQLFGVFRRLHATDEFEGTGVGLAIVRQVVQRHGGRVWAEGAVGRGATFYFALPAGAVAAPRQGAPEDGTPGAPHGGPPSAPG